MVVIEAAAITAGGAAAYQGGKVAFRETSKRISSKIKTSRQEKDRKERFDSRKQERKERFAKVNQYRESLKEDVGRMGKQGNGGAVLSNFSWGKDACEKKNVGCNGSSTLSSSSYSSRPSSSRETKSSSSLKFW